MFFGGVCPRHPELKGERYLSKRDCPACVKARRVISSPEYKALSARLAEVEALALARLQEIERFRRGLERIARIDCGCVPCTGQCRDLAELDARMDYAQELLEGKE